MDQLLDFITRNMTLLIFVGIAFFSMLGKLKGKNPGSPTPSMPTFGGEPLDSEERPGSESAASKQKQESPARGWDWEAISNRLEHSEKPDSRSRERESLQPGRPVERPKRMVADAPTGQEPGHDQMSMGLRKLGAEELKNAVIWAEVLGPPRSKRRSHRL